MGNVITRTITGILLILLVLLISFNGGLLLLISTIFLSLFAAIEFNRAMSKISLRYPLILQIILGIILNIATYYRNFKLILFILALVILISFIFSSLGNKYKLEDMMAFTYAFIYCNFLFNFFILLDNSYQFIIIYLCSWGTDTFAYIFGLLFGKHKLTEKLSPNKTIEGAIGGTLSSIFLVVLYTNYLNFENIFLWALLALLLSIISQTGDLSASYVKRLTGIKDYGNIIIGHGGVLDRFDSVIFVLPMAYFFMSILGG